MDQQPDSMFWNENRPLITSAWPIFLWVPVWLSEHTLESTDSSAVASHRLGWWWWWRRRTASSWEPAATLRSVLRSQTCSWCGPGGRRRSPWCSGGPPPWAGSARCCGKARSAGSLRRRRPGSACRRRWRWCPDARRYPLASSSPG